MLTAHRYVAMHTMQEEGSQQHSGLGNGYAESNAYTPASMQRPSEHGHSPGIRDTMLKVVGMLLPLLAQVGHA